MSRGRPLGALGAALALQVACGGGPVESAPAPAPAPAAPVSAVPEPVATRTSVVSPYAAPHAGELRAASEALAAQVRAHVFADPENGWALAHGLLAFGADAALPDGAPVVDHLLARFAERAGTDREVRLPRATPSGRPLEPHEALVLKTVTELGLPPTREVLVQGSPAQLGDLWRGELGAAWVDGSQMSFTSWRDTPWLIQAAATWGAPGLAWTAEGHRVSLDALVHAAVAELVADTAFLADARQAGGTFQKRGQGIFAHPCGGAHMLQGVATAVAYGFGGEGDRAAMEAQARLHLWRFPRELAILDDAVARAPKELGLLLDVQRLKFAGHHLETVHRLAALGLLPAGDPEVADSLASARAQVLAAVTSLQARQAYDRLPEVRAEREQTFLDLLGDGAHAVHGLAMDAGTATVLR